MKSWKIRERLASVGKKTWIYIGIVAAFVVLAVVCLFVWMRLCGYTLSEWLAKYWPWIAVVAFAAVDLASTLALIGMRKRRK